MWRAIFLLASTTLFANACDSEAPPTTQDDRVLQQRCGGFGPGQQQCPPDYLCVGAQIVMDGLGACRRPCDPAEADGCGEHSTCTPWAGEEHFCKPVSCGGFAGTACPDGLSCVEDGSDSCDADFGDSDCPGICIRAS